MCEPGITSERVRRSPRTSPRSTCLRYGHRAAPCAPFDRPCEFFLQGREMKACYRWKVWPDKTYNPPADRPETDSLTAECESTLLIESRHEINKPSRPPPNCHVAEPELDLLPLKKQIKTLQTASQRHVAELGLLPLLLAALSQHPRHSPVCGNACRCLATLTENHPANQTLLLSLPGPDADAVPSVLRLLFDTLTAHASDCTLSTTVCWALSNLIANKEAVQKRCFGGAELTMIVAMLARFKREERCVEYCCRLLAELTGGRGGGGSSSGAEGTGVADRAERGTAGGRRGSGVREGPCARVLLAETDILALLGELEQLHSDSSGFVLARVVDLKSTLERIGE